MEEVKPEVTNEIRLAAIVDVTSDVPHLNEIKKEFSPSEPRSYGGIVEHAVVKHEDTNIQFSDLQMKSEVLDLNGDVKCGNDNTSINVEPSTNEDLYINNELQERLGQPVKTQVRHFDCDLCKSKLTSKRALERHLHIHPGEKPFPCIICDYKCIAKSILTQHMKTHTGQKPFKCSVCDYSCIRKYNLQEHMKTHTGEKLFKCNVCGYRGRRKCDLQRHVKTHTGEKSFHCHICDYKCIRKSNLQRHVKTHTGVKL